MNSYQTLYTEAQSISADSDSATLALFKSWINRGLQKAYSVLNAERFYSTATDVTVADQYSYPLPPDCGKLHTVVTTISSVGYNAYEYQGGEENWNILINGLGSTTSDYPQYFFVKKDTVEFYPANATAGYTITFKYKVRVKDLSADDFTTASIKTATVGSTAIVGNTGTLWTAAMVGRYFKVNADGIWYRISAIPTSETMTLAREWSGSAIVAGTSAYTIGEMSLLPEEVDDIPLNYALYRYYLQKESDLASTYKALFDEEVLRLKSLSNDTTSGIITTQREIKNKNDYPLNLQ